MAVELAMILSYVTPTTLVEYDMKNRKKNILHVEQVKGFNPSDFVLSRITAGILGDSRKILILYLDSHDGKKIPITVVHKKGTYFLLRP